MPKFMTQQQISPLRLSWLLMAVFWGFFLSTWESQGFTFQNTGLIPSEKNLIGIASILLFCKNEMKPHNSAWSMRKGAPGKDVSVGPWQRMTKQMNRRPPLPSERRSRRSSLCLSSRLLFHKILDTQQMKADFQWAGSFIHSKTTYGLSLPCRVPCHTQKTARWRGPTLWPQRTFRLMHETDLQIINASQCISMGWNVRTGFLLPGFSTVGEFDPPGNISQCLGTFQVVTTGVREYYWHLVGRGQGTSYTSHNA